MFGRGWGYAQDHRCPHTRDRGELVPQACVSEQNTLFISFPRKQNWVPWLLKCQLYSRQLCPALIKDTSTPTRGQMRKQPPCLLNQTICKFLGIRKQMTGRKMGFPMSSGPDIYFYSDLRLKGKGLGSFPGFIDLCYPSGQEGCLHPQFYFLTQHQHHSQQGGS